MRPFSLVSLIGSVAVLLSTVLASTATATEDRQNLIEIQNLFYGECLTYHPGGDVSLAPCGESIESRWLVDLGYVSEIRSPVTGECLEDIDTSNEWGNVVMRPCSGMPRQLWGVSPGPGLIQNLDSGQYLKANHHRVVYAGDLEHYYPHWEVG